jgi:hypothetical protein
MIQKNTNKISGFDVVLDGSVLYDLTLDDDINNIDMRSIYDKSLISEGLVVDVNLTTQSFMYLRNMEHYSDVHLLPFSDDPTYKQMRYPYYTPTYRLYADRMHRGWTLEFLTDFNRAATRTNNILYYTGKIMNLSGQTDQLADNNFAIMVEGDSLVFKQVKNQKTCDCDTATNEVAPRVWTTQFVLPTGTTKHHLVVSFERNIKLTPQQLLYEGANLDCTNFPNNHWYDGVPYRMGKVKIYLDGVLRQTLEDFEEPLLRATADVVDFMQGWGVGDESEYPVSVDYGLDGYFSGTLYRGRFYDRPLLFPEVKTNFDAFDDLFDLNYPLSTC